MNGKFSLLPLFLLLCLWAKAQDKIININHDTIHCNILSIGNERIMYEQKNNDGSVTGKFIPLSQVAEYSRSRQTDINEVKLSKPGYAPEKPFCLGLNVGISTMPWYLDDVQSSSGMPDFYNKLKTGLHVDANFHYMINGFFGLGVAYSFFKTSTNGSMLREYSSSIFLMVPEKHRLYTNYVGASVLFQQHLDAKRKFMLSESLSGGVLFVRMENQIIYPDVNQYGYADVADNTLLTGSSYSGKVGLTAEYKLLKTLSVGLSGDFIYGLLKKAKIEEKGPNGYSYSSGKQDLSNALKVSRFDFSFVMRYYF